MALSGLLYWVTSLHSFGWGVTWFVRHHVITSFRVLFNRITAMSPDSATYLHTCIGILSWLKQGGWYHEFCLNCCKLLNLWPGKRKFHVIWTQVYWDCPTHFLNYLETTWWDKPNAFVVFLKKKWSVQATFFTTLTWDRICLLSSSIWGCRSSRRYRRDNLYILKFPSHSSGITSFTKLSHHALVLPGLV